MRIYMARDRQEVDEANAPWRVLVQDRPLEDHDLPKAARGRNWERREYEIPDSVFQAVLTGKLSFDSVDRIHRAWWSAAAPKGVGPWPE